MIGRTSAYNLNTLDTVYFGFYAFIESRGNNTVTKRVALVYYVVSSGFYKMHRNLVNSINLYVVAIQEQVLHVYLRECNIPNCVYH